MFLKFTERGNMQIVNLSFIFSIKENPNGGTIIVTDDGNLILAEEPFDAICEALDEILR